MAGIRAICLLLIVFLAALAPIPGKGQGVREALDNRGWSMSLPETPERDYNNTGAAERATIVDILDRIERFATMSQASTGLILEGLESMSHPMARLEAGLLRIHGPAPYRDLAQGIAELNALLEPGSEILEPTARRLVRLIVDHSKQVLALDTRLGILSEALEQQREANQQAQEKLDALRRIDGTLESGPKPDAGDVEDDNGNDSP